MNDTTGKSPATNNDKKAGDEKPQPLKHEVTIHESESGADVEPGRTPGKAEGVEEPERKGNQ